MIKQIAFISVVVMVLAFCDAAPLQELPPKKDHVPVYIRVGDTPLAEINPGLARAFNEDKIEGSKSVEEEQQEPEEKVEIGKELEEAEKSQDEEKSPQVEEETVEDEAGSPESQPKPADENAENDEKSPAESSDGTKDVPKEE